MERTAHSCRPSRHHPNPTRRRLRILRSPLHAQRSSSEPPRRRLHSRRGGWLRSRRGGSRARTGRSISDLPGGSNARQSGGSTTCSPVSAAHSQRSDSRQSPSPSFRRRRRRRRSGPRADLNPRGRARYTLSSYPRRRTRHAALRDGSEGLPTSGTRSLDDVER